tara:strand:+ start:488 stop:1084 length:597 start_codon:yes stop_codon:yes gene_type:complete
MAITINGTNNTISGLAVGGLPDGCVDADTLASGVGGKLLQVQTGIKTDQSTMAVNINAGYASYGIIHSVNITPQLSNSKILVMYTISGSGSQGSHAVSTIRKVVSGSSDAYPFLSDTISGFYRATTGTRFIGSNDHNISQQSFTGLDTAGTTSQITYRIVGATEGAATWRINNNGTDNNSASWSASFATAITVMEIAV